jgi:hypothetical protein
MFLVLIIDFCFWPRNKFFKSSRAQRKSCAAERREFAQEFFQFSCVFQTSMSDECWWELRSESLHKNSVNSHVSLKQVYRWVLMRVERWEFARGFCQLSCAGQTRMRVEKREFVRGFCQLSCAGQTRMRVEKREFARGFCQLSCAGQTRMRVNWWEFSSHILCSWLIKRAQTLINSDRILNKFKVDESWWKWTRGGGKTRASASTLFNDHPRLTPGLKKSGSAKLSPTSELQFEE